MSQPDGLQAAMITIFCTQKLDLKMVILVNVAVNTPIDEESNATAGMQMITRSYLCLRVIGNIVTNPERDNWLQQTRLWIATAENSSI